VLDIVDPASMAHLDRHLHKNVWPPIDQACAPSSTLFEFFPSEERCVPHFPSRLE